MTDLRLPLYYPTIASLHKWVIRIRALASISKRRSQYKIESRSAASFVRSLLALRNPKGTTYPGKANLGGLAREFNGPEAVRGVYISRNGLALCTAALPDAKITFSTQNNVYRRSLDPPIQCTHSCRVSENRRIRNWRGWQLERRTGDAVTAPSVRRTDADGGFPGKKSAAGRPERASERASEASSARERANSRVASIRIHLARPQCKESS